VLAADQNDTDAETKLQTAQQYLNMDALYQAIRELREENLWQAVLDALDDFTNRYPEAPDADNLRAWAEACKKHEDLYTTAKAARNRGDWIATLRALNDIDPNQVNHSDIKGLRSWAEEEQNTYRHQTTIAALEKVLADDPDNNIAKNLLNNHCC
jgi:hypothetical protein